MIELLWNGPISEDRMEVYIESLGLTAGQRVLDVGCGCGEVLIRICERYGVSGTGIDSSGPHVAEANRRARERIPAGAIEFVETEAVCFEVQPESFDLVVCMGSTHAFGPGPDAYDNALKHAAALVVGGGMLLVADGYLKQPADPEYRRQFLGETMPEGMTHAANVAAGKTLGLISLAAWTSIEAEWDDFEWAYQRIVERTAAERPDDPQLAERLARRREWMDGYLNWGRNTLGYGIYLFQKPN